MREIKFRAWSGKRMVPVPELDIDEDGIYVNGGDLNPEEGFWIQDDAVLMQYTGIHDKNGKEIYEGDIITSLNWWWGPCFVFYHVGEAGPCRGDNVMEWRLGKNINNPTDHDIHNLWNGGEVEVIGNIYENPELTEK